MTNGIHHISNAAASFWIEASAGTGKTKILVDRVINLLLAGARPDRLLCLTFTKAAAAEMANRIRDRLSQWASLPEEKLVKELQELTQQADVKDKILTARDLLNEVLRVPGGLQVQTIHGFCQYILKRFPLEANIQPHFEVMDEHRQTVLWDQAFALTIQNVDTGTLHTLFEYCTLTRLQELICQDAVKNLTSDSFEILNIKEGVSLQQIVDSALQETPEDLLEQWKTLGWEGYRDLFLTQKGTIRKKLLPGSGIETFLLEQEAHRILMLDQRLKHCCIAGGTNALKIFTQIFYGHYERLKQDQAVLDYDDLIQKTARLLKNPDMGAWVLYKLDEGVDHILVDEAQDTNQAQWDIIYALSQEFFVGESARTMPRSLFVVGDSKQSIYSFQGADPAAFQEMRHQLQRHAQGAGLPFYIADLSISYRSVPSVLKAVDQVFHTHMAEVYRHHIPHREKDGGLVEIWPLVIPTEKETTEVWDLPTKTRIVVSPKRQLADKMARTIRGWFDSKEILASAGRPIEPRDIMILVRHRDELGIEIISAFKNAGIPIAGIDRLKLNEHILVQDLLAIGQWCLFPEDDLLLATILKGPFFNYTEEQIFDLCHGRGNQTLWRHLHLHGAPRLLGQWQQFAKELAPFEFFSKVLNSAHEGHKTGYETCIARFGKEAEDIFNEFLNVCLRSEFSNLTLFLEWSEKYPQEIKRDFEQVEDNVVRILTVHASKGLQAPVVFLPDTTQVPVEPSHFVYGAEGQVLWVPRSVLRTAHMEILPTLSRDQQEYQRLLYVAMTRAQDRLYICGATNQSGATLDSGCWYKTVRDSLMPIAERVPMEDGELLRIYNTQDREVPPQVILPEILSKYPLPEWYHQIASEERIPTAKPSEEGMDVLIGSDLKATEMLEDLSPRERGILIHKLLEHLFALSPVERHDRGLAFLEANKLPAALQTEVLQETLQLLDNPDMTQFFTSTSYAEVGVMGEIEGKLYRGYIDRLIIDHSAQQIYILDFKSGPVPSVIPDQYRQQLLVYTQLVQPTYPTYSISGILIWTKIGSIQPISF